MKQKPVTLPLWIAMLIRKLRVRRKLLKQAKHALYTIAQWVEKGIAWGIPCSSFPEVPDFHSPIPRGIDFIAPWLLEVLAKYLEDLENWKISSF